MPVRRAASTTTPGRAWDDDDEGGAVSEIYGRGIVVSGAGCVGVGRRAREVADVFALLRDPRLEETILLVDSASATAVVPLLAKVRGIVCTSGGMTSHLAIVSREFGIPCVMAADIPDLDALDARQITVGGDGTVGAAPA